MISILASIHANGKFANAEISSIEKASKDWIYFSKSRFECKEERHNPENSSVNLGDGKSPSVPRDPLTFEDVEDDESGDLSSACSCSNGSVPRHLTRGTSVP